MKKYILHSIKIEFYEKKFTILKNGFSVFMALFSVWGWGQTTIFNYQNTTATIPTSFILNNGNATNDIDKSSYLLLDAGGTGTDDITTADLSLSSYNKLTISFQIQSFVSGNYTPLKIEYLTSGSAWTT